MNKINKLAAAVALASSVAATPASAVYYPEGPTTTGTTVNNSAAANASATATGGNTRNITAVTVAPSMPIATGSSECHVGSGVSVGVLVFAFGKNDITIDERCRKEVAAARLREAERASALTLVTSGNAGLQGAGLVALSVVDPNVALGTNIVSINLAKCPHAAKAFGEAAPIMLANPNMVCPPVPAPVVVAAPAPVVTPVPVIVNVAPAVAAPAPVVVAKPAVRRAAPVEKPACACTNAPAAKP